MKSPTKVKAKFTTCSCATLTSTHKSRKSTRRSPNRSIRRSTSRSSRKSPRRSPRKSPRRSSRRSPVRSIDIPHPGDLGKYGYTNIAALSARERHEIIDRMARVYGADALFKKINAVAVLNKNKPVGARFRADANYIARELI